MNAAGKGLGCEIGRPLTPISKKNTSIYTSKNKTFTEFKKSLFNYNLLALRNTYKT